jgi:hypothetical protein
MPKKYRILDNGQDSNSNALEKEMEDYYKSFPKKEFDDMVSQAVAAHYKRSQNKTKRPSNPTGKKSKKSKAMVKKYK